VARGSIDLRAGLSRGQLVYLAFRAGRHLAPAIPRRLAYQLADRLGDLAYLLNGPGREAVVGNLSQVLGRPPGKRRVQQVFRHGARNYFDTLLIPSLGPDQLRDLVKVDDWSALDRALDGGRGAIMVGAHLSSVALTGQLVAARGYAVTSVAERVEPPDLNELLLRLRSGGGVRVLALGRQLTGELLATLARNEVVGLVMDRDIAGTGVRVEFFGAPASLPGGPALLALRSGAPVLPAAAVRTPDQRFQGLIGPPIDMVRGGDLRASVALSTQAIARALEALIEPYVEQWTIYQPIWAPAGGRVTGPRGRPV
jgi:KDO2-lipid IV(A) lauroyltransferase